MVNRKRFAVPVILFSMILLVLGGCSASKYGRLESDKKIKQSFESYQVLPNHKYYYRGVSSKPVVIVGIEENYELNLRMWVKIDTDSDDFRRLINIVSLQGMGNTIEPWGFRILDKTGNYVGVWYSALRAAAVDINENRQIVNLRPSEMVVRGEHQR